MVFIIKIDQPLARLTKKEKKKDRESKKAQITNIKK